MRVGSVVSVVGKRRRWVRGVACCLVMGALASCGGGGGEGQVYEGLVTRTPSESPEASEPRKPADEVRGERLSREAMRLLKDTDSVRIGVEMNAPGKYQKVSVHMDRRNNCTGTFDSGPTNRGEVLMIGTGDAYFRFSDDALDAIRDAGVARGPEAGATARERTELARGKYVKLPTGGRAPGGVSPKQTCDLDRMLGELNGTSEDDLSGARALPDRRWHGEQVTPVTATDGGQDVTVYLATGDKPYIVGMTQTRGDEQMEMRISDYDKPVVARAPDPSLVLDLEALGMDGGGSVFEV